MSGWPLLKRVLTRPVPAWSLLAILAILALSLLSGRLRVAQLSDLVRTQQRLIGALTTRTAKPSDRPAGSENAFEVLSSARVPPHYEEGSLTGLRIHDIVSGSLFARLGVRDGDVIRSINGRRLDTPEAIARAIAELTYGVRLVLDVHTPGSGSRTLELTPEPSPPGPSEP